MYAPHTRSRSRGLTTYLAIVALAMLICFAVLPRTVSASPIEGLLPGHSCQARLRDLPVGGTTTCLVRINNHAAVAAVDVEAHFSNTNLTVTNLRYRLGPSGPIPACPGTNCLNENNTDQSTTDDLTVHSGLDIPAGSGLYLFFTATRSNSNEGAPRYPIVCASASNLPEVCSQGGTP